MITCTSDANDGKTSYDHGDRKRDHQLNGAVTTGVAEGLYSHNVCWRTFRSFSTGHEGTPASTLRQ